MHNISLNVADHSISLHICWFNLSSMVILKLRFELYNVGNIYTIEYLRLLVFVITDFIRICNLYNILLKYMKELVTGEFVEEWRGWYITGKYCNYL